MIGGQGTLVVTLYDEIGCTYAGRRKSDPRIAVAIERALLGCESILNVGAGTGSYEPRSQFTVAVEPSAIMIAQRPIGAAPVVQTYAEALPFSDHSFDAVLGVLTIHHWKDQVKGFAECNRVARAKIVFLTIDIEACASFWLFDYFPELLRTDRRIFPSIARFHTAFEAVESIVVPIPEDCCDGFLAAYWKRPGAYLDPIVRNSMSSFSKIGNVDSQLKQLETDVSSGEWDRRYASLRHLSAIDLGYRIVIASKSTSARDSTCEDWRLSG
jgi:SAM-dependent methyltransferase